MILRRSLFDGFPSRHASNPGIDFRSSATFFLNSRLSSDSRYRGRTAHVTQKQDFYLEVSALIGDAQLVADSNIAGGLRHLPVGLDSSQLAGPFCQSPRLEKSRGPEPHVHPYGGHALFSYKDGCPILAAFFAARVGVLVTTMTSRAVFRRFYRSGVALFSPDEGNGFGLPAIRQDHIRNDVVVRSMPGSVVL